MIKKDFIIKSFASFYEESMPPQTTVTLFVVDNQPDTAELVRLIRKAISIGSKYFLSWGLKADELHDLFDDVIISEQIEKYGPCYDPPAKDVIMTTDHSDESAEEIVFHFFNCPGQGDLDCRYLVLYDLDGLYMKTIKQQLAAAYDERQSAV